MSFTRKLMTNPGWNLLPKTLSASSPAISGKKAMKRTGIKLTEGILAFLLLLIFGVSTNASDIQPLKISVKSAPPFVIVDNTSGSLSGFSIDLMTELIKMMEMPVKVEYKIYPDLPSHLESVKTGKADLGIAATTITAEREKEMDFSLPFYKTGLSILVSPKAKGWGISHLFTRNIRLLLLSLVVYILICAILIWFFERGSPAFDDRWLYGIAQGIWWTIITMSTVGYGDIVPRKTSSRIMATLIIFSGITFFGLAIASFSSVLTVRSMQSNISSIQDLVGKQVGVVNGTIAQQLISRMPIRQLKADNLNQAIELLVKKDVIAVVHDRPQLQHYIKTKAVERFVLTGGIIEPKYYGITLPIGSPLRKKINLALLRLMEGEDSIYERLLKKWFGSE